MKTSSLTLPDGRILETMSAGNESDQAVIFHHGTPGSTLTWSDWLTEVSNQGGYAIAYSRAGYGGSSRHADRTVFTNTQDIRALISHFQVASFVSIGASGGGPHALADTTIAAARAAICIASVAPYDADGLDFLEGMGQENHIEFNAAVAGASAVDEWMRVNAPESAKVTGPQLIEAFGGLVGPADKQSLTPVVAEEVAASFRHALSASYHGWMDDDLAFVQPWGFNLGEIFKPVEIWQGNEDLMVPHSHAQWLSANIKSAKLHFVPNEGHISLGLHQRSQIISNALNYLKA